MRVEWSCLVHMTNLDGVESFKSTDIVNAAISQTIRVDSNVSGISNGNNGSPVDQVLGWCPDICWGTVDDERAGESPIACH